MSAIQLLSTINFITSIIRVAETKGVNLEIGTDFIAFRDALKKTDKGLVAPIFDPDFSSVSAANGFWILGRNMKGEIIHSQAIRLVDLSGVRLADHLSLYLRDYQPNGDQVDSLKSSINLSPLSSELTGRLCYHGELWLKNVKNNLAGSLTATLTRLAPAMASLQWSPDYYFGIVAPFTSCKGMVARLGYTHLEQGSIFWHRNNGNARMEEWLGWMDQKDLEHLMRIPPENFDTWYTPRTMAS